MMQWSDGDFRQHYQPDPGPPGHEPRDPDGREAQREPSAQSPGGSELQFERQLESQQETIYPGTVAPDSGHGGRRVEPTTAARTEEDATRATDPDWVLDTPAAATGAAAGIVPHSLN